MVIEWHPNGDLMVIYGDLMASEWWLNGDLMVY